MYRILKRAEQSRADRNGVNHLCSVMRLIAELFQIAKFKSSALSKSRAAQQSVLNNALQLRQSGTISFRFVEFCVGIQLCEKKHRYWMEYHLEFNSDEMNRWKSLSHGSPCRLFSRTKSTPSFGVLCSLVLEIIKRVNRKLIPTLYWCHCSGIAHEIKICCKMNTKGK